MGKEKNHAETWWAVRDLPFAVHGIEEGLDGLTTFGNKVLLVSAP